MISAKKNQHQQPFNKYLYHNQDYLEDFTPPTPRSSFTSPPSLSLSGPDDNRGDRPHSSILTDCHDDSRGYNIGKAIHDHSRSIQDQICKNYGSSITTDSNDDFGRSIQNGHLGNYHRRTSISTNSHDKGSLSSFTTSSSMSSKGSPLLLTASSLSSSLKHQHNIFKAPLISPKMYAEPEGLTVRYQVFLFFQILVHIHSIFYPKWLFKIFMG